MLTSSAAAVAMATSGYPRIHIAGSVWYIMWCRASRAARTVPATASVAQAHGTTASSPPRPRIAMLASAPIASPSIRSGVSPKIASRSAPCR